MGAMPVQAVGLVCRICCPDSRWHTDKYVMYKIKSRLHHGDGTFSFINPKSVLMEGDTLTRQSLSTETESLDNGTVAIDVAVVEVVKESTTLADKLCQ